MPDARLTQVRGALIAFAITAILTGCDGKPAAISPDDAAINMQVQARLFSDQNLNGQSIRATVGGGIVTLSGTVTSDAARNNAAGDAAQVAGVRTVVNNLIVQPGAPASAQVAAAAPAPAPTLASATMKTTIKPSAPAQQPTYQPAPVVRAAPPAPAPAPQLQQPQPDQVQAQLPAASRPQPVIHNITLPAGTSLPIRITQTLDSATSQTGDRFSGALASDIITDDMVVLPQGTSVTGHVDSVQDAAHFKGSSLLSISLSAIERRGERIQIVTDSYTRQGEGRGKNTAEKVGGGAAVGAILGGIFGGGKGAAIGAAAGGGVGAGANTVTRGQQVQIPSETVVRFRLTSPIIVRVGSGERDDHNLERRNEP